MEDKFIQLGNSNRGIMLNEYKGELSIVEAREAPDGKLWINFCYPQYQKQPQEPAVPKGIKLGSPAQAAKILKQLLAMVQSGTTPATAAKTLGGKVVDDDTDSIPF
jgi:hypothetical protein